jgi:hypothetical protein
MKLVNHFLIAFLPEENGLAVSLDSHAIDSNDGV